MRLPAVAILAATVLSPSRIVFLGTDFSHATFYDEHLVKEKSFKGEDPVSDLTESKVPDWNHQTAIYFADEAPDFGWKNPEVDLGQSTIANKTVTTNAIKTVAPAKTAVSQLTPELLSSEVENYVAKGSDEMGFLVMVDQINKRHGVIIHCILFNRGTGEVLFAERTTGNPGGYGIRNYYLNGLKPAIKKFMKDAKRRRPATSSGDIGSGLRNTL